MKIKRTKTKKIISKFVMDEYISVKMNAEPLIMTGIGTMVGSAVIGPVGNFMAVAVREVMNEN